MAQFRQTYTSDGGGTTKTKATTTSSTGPYTSSSYGSYIPSSLGTPAKATTSSNAKVYTSSTPSTNPAYNASSASTSTANSKKYYTPNGSVSTAVVAGRADAVPQSNVSTNNSYYTVYDGTNRTAIDSKTGKAVGSAQGAYNSTTSNNYPSNGSSSGGSDGGSSGGSYPEYSSSYSSSADYSQESNDILQTIMDLLKGQQEKAEQAYKAQLEDEYAKNEQLHRSNANQINLNRERATRYSRGLYGDSGTNDTNNARIANAWASGHNENNRNLATNNSESLQRYNTNLSNAYNTLASGYSNFVLPVYTNRQQYLDELKYRRDANAQDYDYRKFLASSGIL